MCKYITKNMQLKCKNMLQLEKVRKPEDKNELQHLIVIKNETTINTKRILKQKNVGVSM